VTAVYAAKTASKPRNPTTHLIALVLVTFIFIPPALPHTAASECSRLRSPIRDNLLRESSVPCQASEQRAEQVS
jgi:hypothetical protein